TEVKARARSARETREVAVRTGVIRAGRRETANVGGTARRTCRVGRRGSAAAADAATAPSPAASGLDVRSSGATGDERDRDGEDAQHRVNIAWPCPKSGSASDRERPALRLWAFPTRALRGTTRSRGTALAEISPHAD